MGKDKRTINEEVKRAAIWIIVFIFIIMVIIPFLSGFYSGITSSYTSDLESIRNEYNNYTALIDSDMTKMTKLYNNWIDAYNNAIRDKQLTNSEVQDMGNAINEYALEYKIVRQHINNFKEFVIKYEDDLKTLGIDTFKLKISIDDTLIDLDNNIKRMETSTQSLIEAYNQYRQQLLDYLKLLTVLA